MPYFNYHATAKRLISQGKLRGYFFCERYRSISPALVLLFDDVKHPSMPIRQERFEEYIALLDKGKEMPKK